MQGSLENRVIGAVAGPLTRRQTAAGESTLGDVTADAIQVGSRGWGGNVATFLSPRELHADLVGRTDSSAPGTITYGMAAEAVPPAQANTTTTLTGAQIHQALEQQFGPRPDPSRMLQISQGLTYTWDAAKPVGQRVDPASIVIGGAVVNPAASYRVTVSDYLMAGGDGFTVFAQGTLIPDGADTGQELDLLAAYLSTRNPLAVPALNRITRIGG